jgi:hypothetical protein
MVRPFVGEYLPLGPKHSLIEADGFPLGWLIGSEHSLAGHNCGL